MLRVQDNLEHYILVDIHLAVRPCQCSCFLNEHNDLYFRLQNLRRDAELFISTAETMSIRHLLNYVKFETICEPDIGSSGPHKIFGMAHPRDSP